MSFRRLFATFAVATVGSILLGMLLFQGLLTLTSAADDSTPSEPASVALSRVEGMEATPVRCSESDGSWSVWTGNGYVSLPGQCASAIAGTVQGCPLWTPDGVDDALGHARCAEVWFTSDPTWPTLVTEDSPGWDCSTMGNRLCVASQPRHLWTGQQSG